MLIAGPDKPDEAAALTERIADRLLSALRPPFNLDKHRIVVTAGIGGVVSFPGDVKPSAEEMLHGASRALRRAKTDPGVESVVLALGDDAAQPATAAPAGRQP